MSTTVTIVQATVGIEVGPTVHAMIGIVVGVKVGVKVMDDIRVIAHATKVGAMIHAKVGDTILAVIHAKIGGMDGDMVRVKVRAVVETVVVTFLIHVIVCLFGLVVIPRTGTSGACHIKSVMGGMVVIDACGWGRSIGLSHAMSIVQSMIQVRRKPPMYVSITGVITIQGLAFGEDWGSPTRRRYGRARRWKDGVFTQLEVIFSKSAQ
jgi:hypothetical protein